jgi:glycosyltransferase involved in cell wall biosynthesis
VHSDPDVSVLIPVYNGAATVARSVESVLAQDHPDFEVVVVDDGSTDGTDRVLERFEAPVRVLRNEKNSGIAYTYNRALRESRGAIVIMLASDCAVVGPDYLRRVLRHFEAPDVGAVAGKAVMTGFASAPMPERIFTRLNILDVNDPDTGVHQVNFVEVRCDAFRREVLEAVGGLNEDLFRSNEDQDLSIRIARRGARLLQDNSLTFELGFGGTEDSLAKLLSKQGQYARGQAYIAVNWGIGSSDGLWTNENRRRRAVHRMSQVASLPLAAAMAAGTVLWPAAGLVLLAAMLARMGYYVRLASGLLAVERAAAAPLGLACDAIYSASFLWSVVDWSLRGKTALRRWSRADSAKGQV